MDRAAAVTETLERRRATEADRAFLELLDRRALGAYAMEEFGWDERELVEKIHKDVDPALRELILLEGEPVGSVVIEDHGEALVIDHIVLAPEVQRRGLGTALIREVQARAAVARTAVRLSVLRANPALALYQRLGFRIIASDAHRIRLEWMPG